MFAVLRRRVDIALCFGAVVRKGSGIGSRGSGLHRIHHCRCEQWSGAHVDERNAGGTVGSNGRNANDRLVLGATVELLERPTLRIEFGDANFGQQLIGSER